MTVHGVGGARDDERTTVPGVNFRSMSNLTDVDAYLDRIGLTTPASLAEVHRAHATSIVFENFDSSSGRPVRLDLAHLEDKMVARRRGGYCFEHNLLLAAACRSMGFTEVVPMLARVRVGPEGGPRPLNHLLLRVVDGGTSWLADVGFGGGGLLDPVPFEPGIESDQAGWRYRLIEEGAELVLQVFRTARLSCLPCSWNRRVVRLWQGPLTGNYHGWSRPVRTGGGDERHEAAVRLGGAGSGRMPRFRRAH